MLLLSFILGSNFIFFRFNIFIVYYYTPKKRGHRTKRFQPNCFCFQFTKVQTLTTNANSMLQTKKALLPVQYIASDGQEKEDILWVTEMER